MQPLRGGALTSIAVVLCLVAGACGDEQPPTGDASIEALGSTSTSTTTTTAESDGPATATSTTTVAVADEPAAVPPGEGEGLTVRIMGELVDGLLCPGGARPCLAYEGEIADGDRVLLAIEVLEELAARCELADLAVDLDVVNLGIATGDGSVGEFAHEGSPSRPTRRRQ